MLQLPGTSLERRCKWHETGVEFSRLFEVSLDDAIEYLEIVKQGYPGGVLHAGDYDGYVTLRYPVWETDEEMIARLEKQIASRKNHAEKKRLKAIKQIREAEAKLGIEPRELPDA